MRRTHGMAFAAAVALVLSSISAPAVAQVAPQAELHSAVKPVPTPEQVKSWYKPGQWNEMSVVAIGRRVVVFVNGKNSAQLLDDPGRIEGHIALQLHGGQDMDVEFADVEILEIPSPKENQ